MLSLWSVRMVLVAGSCMASGDNLPDLFAIAGQMVYFCSF